MLQISISPLDAFTDFVRRWLSLLAAGRLEEAANLIDEPNSYGLQWGAEDIQKALQDYARSDVSPYVTDPEAMPGDGRPNLLELNDGSGYLFDYAVPLNGEWSDLTLQFEFLKKPGGYVVVLQDIHVL
jgi:hypothetical protein